MTDRRVPLVDWDGPLYCHAPADEPFDPGTLAEDGDGGDRWCEPGQPTAYFASDAGVAMAELARHHPPGGAAVERRIMRLDLGPRAIHGLVDLRDPVIRRMLDGPDDAAAFLDREAARGLAARARADERHLGLIVPSMAFLDRHDRPNVVVFADRLGAGGLGAAIERATEIARVSVGGR